MKTIKTRDKVKGIKILDKSVDLSKRMKNSFVRTKEHAEETQNSEYNSPADYASGNIQNTTDNAARDTAHYFSNPRQKAQNNMERAKSYFQVIKRQMPGERKRAAEQAQNAAQKMQTNAEQLRKTADQAGEIVQYSKESVKNAKQTLKEVRQSGRQTLREIKQGAKFEQSNKKANILNGNGNISSRFKDINQAHENFGKYKKIKIYKFKKSETNNLNSDVFKILPTNKKTISGNNKTSNSVLSKVKTKLKKTLTRSVKSAQTSTKVLKTPIKNAVKPEYLIKKAFIPKNNIDTTKVFEKSAKIIKTTKKEFKKTAKGTIKTAKKSIKRAE